MVTRNRKIDPAILEREYIYDAATPPVSFSQLAERHGLARNTVAEKGVKGRWFERRKEFRESLGIKVTEAMGEEWVRFETAAREKLMSLGMSYIEKYEAALKADEVKVSTRDMLGIAAMLRTFIGDAAQAKTKGEEVLLDPDTSDIAPDEYRRALAAIEQIESGGADDAAAAEAAGPPGVGED